MSAPVKDLTDETAKSEEDVMALARERFALADEFWSPLYKKALEYLKFSLGDQWPEELRRARENDPDGARPCLTVDKLGQFVRQVVNSARQNKPSIKPRPVNDEADPEVAEIMEGVIRHIETRSKADIAYDTAVEFATRAGIGFVRIRTDYCDDESFDQDIIIDAQDNPFQCYMQPVLGKDRDGGKCDWGFIFEDMPRADFKRLWPNAQEVDFNSPENNDWCGEETIRVAEYWSCKYVEETIWVSPSGVSTKEVKGAKSRKRQKRVMTWRKITGKEVLEEKEWPSKYIGFVPCWGRLTNIDGKYDLQALITPSIDAQRMHNYSASSVMERACLAPKAKYLAAGASTEGYEDQWQKANTSNTPTLNFNHMDSEGNPIPPPQLQPGPEVPAAWVQLMQSSEHDIQSGLGMFGENLGQQTNAISGRAINARKAQGDLSSFDIIDNQGRMIRQVGNVILDLFPHVYDVRRVMQIEGEDGESETVTLDPKQEEPIRKEQSELNAIRRCFNPNLGKYHITVTVGPSYATKRMEAVDWMTEMMRANPQAAMLLGDLQVKAMDLPYADVAAKRFKAMLPPPVQAIEHEEGNEDPSQLKQQVAMAHDAMQKAQQIIQHLEQELGKAQQQANDKSTDAQLKAGELQLKDKEIGVKEMDAQAKAHESADRIAIDWYQAETARIQAETARLQAMAPAMAPEDIQALVQQAVQGTLNTPLDSIGPAEAQEESQEETSQEPM